MREVIQYALVGLGIGALYSLLAQGLVLIYRGSGVLNFAQGAIGMVAAFISWDLRVRSGTSYLVSFIVGVAVAALLGALVHLVVMRPLRTASPLARVVATLGVLITLQGAAVLRYGSDATFVQSWLPQNVWEVAGVTVTADRVILLALAAALSAVLYYVYKRTKFGVATSAVAENQRAAASLGCSPDTIATANWALGSALAGVAAILIAPIVTLQVTTMTTLVLAALAAALIAGFRSFPIAFVAAVSLGVVQTELQRYVDPHQPGLSSSVPFIVIVGVIVLRGQALPLRDFFLQQLPRVGDGRVRPVWLAIAVLIAVILIITTPTVWVYSIVVTLAVAIICLSIVVLTGYAGQISLAQFAIAGFGAWVAGRLVAAEGWPFWLALIAGVAATVPLGVLFALPAVRSRGINLAIITLGLGTAIELMIFNNGDYVGGFAGTVVGAPTLFGWEIGAVEHPERYAFVVLAATVLVGLMVGNLRRGRAGRRLLAVRTNERAAAALGISVSSTKLYAFAVSAGIAALGGILYGFLSETITFSASFTNFASINALGWSVLGGIGYLFGTFFAATFAPGSIGPQVFDSIFAAEANDWVVFIGGVLIILMVVRNQNGLANQLIKEARWIAGKIGLSRLVRPRVLNSKLPPIEEVGRAEPKTLEVRDVVVRFGAVTAVDGISLTVRPGEIVGLIGPNGAGKTTLIDAITGFVSPAAGSIKLDGNEMGRMPVAKRARAGVSRSFQSLELFEDSTVLDNLQAASDPRDGVSYLRDLVWPITPPLPAPVVAAVHEFDLTDKLDRVVEDLPYGERRLLAVARAVATQPSVLLLDEPAAGLGSTETAEFAHLVRRLADEWGLGVLLIEHDVEFVMNVCDHIVVLDFGKQIAEGAPAAIRNDPKVVAAYLGETDDEIKRTQSMTSETASS